MSIDEISDHDMGHILETVSAQIIPQATEAAFEIVNSRIRKLWTYVVIGLVAELIATAILAAIGNSQWVVVGLSLSGAVFGASMALTAITKMIDGFDFSTPRVKAQLIKVKRIGGRYSSDIN